MSQQHISNMSNKNSEDIDKMTTSHLRNVMQLAVFYTGDNDIYAINISKIKSFVIANTIEIKKTPADNNVVAGIASIRGEAVLIINLDKWLGNSDHHIDEYQVVIVCEFSGKKVGFLAKNILNIEEKYTADLKNTENENPKISYVTEVRHHNKTTLCMIFNAEKLLKDMGIVADFADHIEMVVTEKVNSDQLILIAEDSAVAIELIEKLLKRAKAKFEIYNNGAKLIKRLEELANGEGRGKTIQDIGLIVTDIEMPEKDGFQLTTFVKNDERFLHLPIVVNSSMTTSAVADKIIQLGASELINKSDLKQFYRVIKMHLDNVDINKQP